MSDVIRLLPDSVANQIAAGEVIQRPASVVKELVENAIDAGATHIDVSVKDAGKTLIQVIDDGKGMSETDARLAFERHATSKIKEAADLFALRTMGFRGEALASIAAVAQVELRTRMEGEEFGTQIQIAGSKVESQEVVSCAKGSNFAVRNLFFNVPARRKFLKSNQTELSNILTEFERIALVNPNVSFTLYHNDTEMLNLPAIQLRQRIMGVFGKKLNQDLLSFQIETSMVKIHGYIGKPESARKKGARQFFFVNGRYMRHPYFHKAVADAYEGLIPVGEQVSYFVYFEVDPANIDVNIHPTKTEIKFENEQAIWQILSASAKEALGRSNAVPSIDFDTEGMPDIPAYVQYSWTKGSHVRVGGILRSMTYEDEVSNKAKSITGWGIQASATAGLGNFRAYGQFTYGKGIAQYLNDMSNLNVDIVPVADEAGRMQVLPMRGWFAGLQYNFSKRVFASTSYSQSRLFTKDCYAHFNETQYKKGQYLVANVFWNVTHNFQVGVEYLHGWREDFNDLSREANRINLSAQYNF